MAWEYKIDTLYSNITEVGKLLERRGLDGWELIVYKHLGGGTVMLIFKKQV